MRRINLKHQNQAYPELLKECIPQNSVAMKTTHRDLTERNQRLTEGVASSKQRMRVATRS